MFKKTKRHSALDTDFWIDAFARNQQNRPEPDWDAPLDIPDQVRPALTQSILEFQLGDGGGPAGLIAFNRASFQDETPEVRQVVDLWFDEEKEHSRLLGGWRNVLKPLRSRAIGVLACSVSFENGWELILNYRS